MFESEPRITKVGSPSLVGRGIATTTTTTTTATQPPGNTRFTLNNNHSSNSSSFLFEDYLRSQNKRDIKQIMCYAQRYHIILETGDDTILAQATPAVRRHAMESLAAWSRFNGSHDRWKQIRESFSLR
jgi:hypothetical protein